MKKSDVARRWHRYVIVIAVALSAPAIDPVFAQGPPGGLGVNVLNTPLPVQGAVSVGGSVSISGTPNVNVTNTPSVTVANTASSPVPVAVTSSGAPYSLEVVGDCSNNINCFITFPDVPAGKMLVIRHVSAQARPNSGSPAIFDFAELVTSNTQDPSFGTTFAFPLPRIGLAGSSVLADVYGMNSPVLAFVRPGQRASLTLRTHVSGSILFSSGTISGELINAP